MTITLDDPDAQVRDYALTSCILHEKELDKCEAIARNFLSESAIYYKEAAIVAFEVTLYIKYNLRSKIKYSDGSCWWLVSSPDMLAIAKHAMAVLHNCLVPYTEKFKNLTFAEVQGIARLIAGTRFCDSNGLQFTRITKLYYEKVSKNRNYIEYTKSFLHLGDPESRALYYNKTYPTLEDIQEVVSKVMA